MSHTIIDRMNSAWEGTARFYPMKAESLAQSYIDAEERALSADGEVVDSLSTDLDLEAIALDWGNDTDGFANILTAG